MTGGIIKAIGVIATVMGMGATLVSDWVSEKKMEEKIDEKVKEVLAEKNEDDEEES